MTLIVVFLAFLTVALVGSLAWFLAADQTFTSELARESPLVRDGRVTPGEGTTRPPASPPRRS